MLKSLNVDKRSDKNWLGRTKRGFDFPGFGVTPTSIQPSEASTPRKKTNRYEQQCTSKRRMGSYLGQLLVAGWLCSASFGASASIPDTVFTIPDTVFLDISYWLGSDIKVIAISYNPATELCQFFGTDSGSGLLDLPASTGMLLVDLDVVDFYGDHNSLANSLASNPTACFRLDTMSATNGELVPMLSMFPPVLDSGGELIEPPLIPEAPIEVVCAAADTYASCYGKGVAAYNAASCTGPAEYNGSCGYTTLTAEVSLAVFSDEAQGFTPTPPTPVDTGSRNIPVFGPFGLLVMLFGLLWFGSRRRKH